MTKTEILAACQTFGTARDRDSFAGFATKHAFVTTTRNSPKNAGKVEMEDMLAAYGNGVRAAIFKTEQAA